MLQLANQKDVFRAMWYKGICCSNNVCNVIYTDNKMAYNAGPYYQTAAGRVSDSALEENRNVADCLTHIFKLLTRRGKINIVLGPSPPC